MNKRLFFLVVVILNVFSGNQLLAQPINVQLQVGEEKELGERLGNCVTAGSYQVTPNIDAPLIFRDDQVSMSIIGVFASFSIRAPFDASPGSYSGQIFYEIFQLGGALCFVDTVFLEIEVIPAFEPVPDFQTFPQVIVAGGTVDFENLTQNPVENWLWDFGDGNTSMEKTPSNTYDTPGKYTVSLTATGPGGSAIITKEEYIEVVEPGTPGQSVWKFETEGAFTAPAIDTDGNIYVGSSKSILYSVDPNGNERWTSNIFINDPVIGVSGSIYGSSGKKLLAIDATGSKKWEIELDGTIHNGLFALDEEETAYVGTRSGSLYLIDSTGTEKWKLDLDASLVFSPVIGTDGTIYTLANIDFVTKVFAITPQGNIKWVFERTNFYKPEKLSISQDGNIVVPGSPVSILTPDGQIIWEKSFTNSNISSEIVFDQAGNLYGVANNVTNNKLYSLRPSDGEPNWILDLSSYLPSVRNDLSDPLIGADGTIYCYSKAGLVFAISPAGEILWVHSLVPDDFQLNASSFTDAPAMGPQGLLFIGYEDGALHAISTESPGLLENVWSKRGQNNQNSRQFLCPFPSLIFPTDQTGDLSTSTAFVWSPTILADAYEIEVGLDSLFLEVVHLATVTDTSSQLELEYGTSYYWRVRSTQENGEANCWSATWRFSTQIAPPSSPTLISPADGAVDLPLSTSFSWSAAGAESYAIQVARDSAFTDLERDESDLLDLMVDFLLSDYQTTYYWRVKAVNSTGESDWSEIWRFSTQITPPSSPTLISPADGAVDLPLSTSFSWSAAGAESYAIQVARDSAFTDLERDESDLLDLMVDFLLSDYQTTYYWRVKAVNSTGESDWSEIWRFETTLMTDIQELTAKHNLRVFPNPAQEVLFIEFNSKRSVKTDVWIYSAAGQRIGSTQQHVYEGGNRLEISLSSLPPGIYLFRVIGVDLHLYGKFSKE